MRGAQCTVRTSPSTSHSPRRIVPSRHCENANLTAPDKVKSCGGAGCPHWSAGEWSPCESSRCFNWRTAMQRREIKCRSLRELENGTQIVSLLELSNCEESSKPTQRRECYNDACKGVWRVGEWSECTASCNENGIKYRILQCVWFGTKKPAGNACRNIPRPSVMKTCRSYLCPNPSGQSERKEN
ncbi:A disintegrin and metalloproteinase with thrombospondin motifs 20-like [Orussus abietinus]|uniref:A disintegrin and metalloproteinase with thrombospondin motifs 20-like n=1 Tax=Orussus abietinus TaxID=222816 RepID=UPI000C715C7A|nr:A disintegrin and metalloproteinase with thrombospondin motifs 20-like [Orussus abietinus]